jgi:hypothetical protein
MSVEFEIDLAEIESATRGLPIIRGADVLGAVALIMSIVAQAT